MGNVIEASIVKGQYKEEEVLIPSNPMIQTDVPYDFNWLQFPVRLDFSMAI